MQTRKHDLVVIGGGPGGYIAAIRAAQLGLDTACVEKEPLLGGTCLRIGCIPSKALLESSERFAEARHGLELHGVQVSEVRLDLATMLKRKDAIVRQLTNGVAGLFKKNKVTRYAGLGTFNGPGVVEVQSETEPVRLEAKNVIIATGSEVSPLAGVELDGDRIGTSTEALAYPQVPEHLVVIGAGVIGLELGSVWSRLGARVTVLEYLDRILPGTDTEIATVARKLFEKQGLTFRLGVRVTGARREGDHCIVTADGLEPITCDRVLLAVGRRPNTRGLGLETLGLALDGRGRVPTDTHFQTTVPGVYAIGDVIAGPMLAHKAEEEGVACVEYIATGHGHVNYDAIPNVVYTAPEIATVGKSEEELVAAGVPYRKGTFPFMANGRAKALAQTDGLVKVLAHRDTDRLLGVHIVGPRAGDLIAEAAVAMEYGATSEDVARACHAHPTLAEALKEAALAVDGRTLNY
jgi:dihydrolipoamide dehydrogenase